jgi:hypothetical protein
VATAGSVTDVDEEEADPEAAGISTSLFASHQRIRRIDRRVPMSTVLAYLKVVVDPCPAVSFLAGSVLTG